MTESLAWTCRCGAWCWNHYAHCAACGTEKPAPQEAQPTDEARPEPPWRMPSTGIAPWKWTYAR